MAESLAEALKPLLSAHARVLLVKGNLARDTLREQLSNIANVTDWIVYETTYNEEAKPQLIHFLQQRMIDAITFTSSSTVHSFAQAIAGETLTCLSSQSHVSVRLRNKLHFSLDFLFTFVHIHIQSTRWLNNFINILQGVNNMQFARHRRLRQTANLRAMVRETHLHTEDFIYPILSSKEKK